MYDEDGPTPASMRDYGANEAFEALAKVVGANAAPTDREALDLVEHALDALTAAYDYARRAVREEVR